MKQEFVQVGRIVNAHGVRGELRVMPMELEAQTVAGVRQFLLDGQSVEPLSCRVHKDLVLIRLPGVDDMDAALALKGQILSVRREDLPLGPGECLDGELLGMEVFDADTGAALGMLVKVEEYPAHKVYTVKGKREFMVPAVPGVFIQSADLEKNRMEIHMMEGLVSDED